MRVLLCSVLAVGLSWPSGIVAAAPPPTVVPPTASDAPPEGEVPLPPDATATDAGVADLVAEASEAWTQGDWGKVRGLLAVVVDDPGALSEPHIRTQVLLLLADATLNDATLDAAERRRVAASYLGRQMDADASWRMPPDIYTKALFDLYVEVSGERSRDEIDRCLADLMACRSDVKNEEQKYRELKRKYDDLEKAYAEQEVEVRDRVARSRLFAAIPFGAGHFYNGDRAIGAAFLSAELAVGITGLTLLLYRYLGDGCRRTRAFQRGSLVCTSSDLDSIRTRRKTEETMAWFFYGSMALDVVLAQIRFESFETVEVRRVPRSDLDNAEPGRRGKRRPTRKKTKASVRPTAGGHRHGANLGVSIRF